MAKKKYIWIIGTLLIVGALFFSFSESRVNGYAILNGFGGDITIYKDTSCGCCTIYGNYFKSKGNSNTKVITTGDVDSIKTKYRVPKALESCHTTIIGDYFVEGHIPLEAVEKLLKEKPDIKGLAMPGMPEGSPGMMGSKRGDFVIYAVDYDGGYKEFMRL